jgi:glycine cleavage system regulatory protein
MQTPLVLTIIGADRTGLVESVSGIVADHGGNWLESRLCRLGGQFAGILRIEVPAENQAALTRALATLQREGLSVAAYPDQPDAGTSVDEGSLNSLEIVGHDRPGIVHEISRALAAQGVNVEELASECVSAPMTGEILFKARARLRLPPGCRVGALREQLEHIASDLMVDISFSDVEPVPLPK